MSNDAWSAAELDIVGSYFNTGSTILNIHAKLQREGYHRTPDAIRNRIWIMRNKGGFERRRETTEKQLRIGYLDIEATHLKANFGIILCWYIKVAGQNKYYSSVVKPTEMKRNRKGEKIRDKRVVSELLDAFEHFDCLYVHYGADRRFDVPYIRSRALWHGFGSKLGKVCDERFLRDTWLIARNKLAISSNRLDTLAKFFHVKAAKTELLPDVWNDARDGEQKALKYIAEHCKADVDVLELVHKAMEPVEKKSYIRM